MQVLVNVARIPVLSTAQVDRICEGAEPVRECFSTLLGTLRQMMADKEGMTESQVAALVASMSRAYIAQRAK